MSEYIECRNCDSLYCDGCNIYSLATMLNNGKFDCLMNNNHSINSSANVVSQAVFDQIKWERDTALATLEEHGIGLAEKADVVEVVRCKDCKHFCPYEGEEHKGDCAELVGLESCVYEDDYCSYGERRSK